jgi:hypothetical protein
VMRSTSRNDRGIPCAAAPDMESRLFYARARARM